LILVKSEFIFFTPVIMLDSESACPAASCLGQAGFELR
jgi:hypothetical protein